MREERQIPKTRETVRIPQDLSSFLSDVHRMIEEGSEEATLESDDLLQCESAFGGLEDKETGIYSFTYFPDEHGTRNKWEFVLSRPEIGSIANREITQLELWGVEVQPVDVNSLARVAHVSIVIGLMHRVRHK